MRAFGEDLLKWVGSENTEKQLQLDWYDSHTDEEFLTNLKVKGNIITMFYPNRCTDILATCDGGLIKQLQGFFKQGVEKELEDHFDQMTGTDTISRKIQRDFILDSMNTAIEKITTEGVTSIAERCGAVFDLCASLEKQFHKVKLRGYTVDGVEEKLADGTFRYKNIFEGFDEAKSTEERKLWKEAERKRRIQNAKMKKSKKKKKR